MPSLLFNSHAIFKVAYRRLIFVCFMWLPSVQRKWQKCDYIGMESSDVYSI